LKFCVFLELWSKNEEIKNSESALNHIKTSYNFGVGKIIGTYTNINRNSFQPILCNIQLKNFWICQFLHLSIVSLNLFFSVKIWNFLNNLNNIVFSYIIWLTNFVNRLTFFRIIYNFITILLFLFLFFAIHSSKSSSNFEVFKIGRVQTYLDKFWKQDI